MNEGISFSELLEYITDETRRWSEWFAQNPAALEVPVGAPGTETATLRGMLAHIFFCDLFYAELLSDKKPDFAAYEKIARHTVQELFTFGASTQQQLGAFIARAGGSGMSAIISIGWPAEKPITGTKRKMLAHVLLHSLRHWAQVATALRQSGYKAEWGHDLLFSSALP